MRLYLLLYFFLLFDRYMSYSITLIQLVIIWNQDGKKCNLVSQCLEEIVGRMSLIAVEIGMQWW